MPLFDLKRDTKVKVLILKCKQGTEISDLPAVSGGWMELIIDD